MKSGENWSGGVKTFKNGTSLYIYIARGQERITPEGLLLTGFTTLLIHCKKILHVLFTPRLVTIFPLIIPGTVSAIYKGYKYLYHSYSHPHPALDYHFNRLPEDGLNGTQEQMSVWGNKKILPFLFLLIILRTVSR